MNIDEDEPEWDPTPNERQMIKEDDPLDYVTLALLFMEYEEDDDTVDLGVGGEEWIVGRAALEEGLIGDDLWACETMEELGEAMTATWLDKGKHKAETDLTDLYDDYVELWDEAYTKLVNHVTRSSCVYLP
ncbi:hypothetical protein RHMOL_Rhmol04G0177500 [Rhododendron molle]|uniref:Uncharacterized protein n=1 Tax=Rhododendron molle TaxID=49168 RepID=A0ACC0P2P6_RHOML|nr:hypothetical protein RHMOL_Rhmol04G0177500 [Rhododendron molle]